NEKRDSACAIGLASVVDGQIAHSEKHLIRPHELRFAEHLVRNIHGISEHDVKDAPTLKELWPRIWEICQGRLIVAHNTSFDSSVLRYSLPANGVEFPRFDYLCTFRLSQSAWPALGIYRLGFLASQYNIPLEHHCPKSDAEASATLLLKALQDHSH